MVRESSSLQPPIGIPTESRAYSTFDKRSTPAWRAPPSRVPYLRSEERIRKTPIRSHQKSKAVYVPQSQDADSYRAFRSLSIPAGSRSKSKAQNRPDGFPGVPGHEVPRPSGLMGAGNVVGGSRRLCEPPGFASNSFLRAAAPFDGIRQ